VHHERDLILVAGRLDPVKNLHTLLHALAIVFRQREARAVFCGEGPLRDALMQTARELGIAERLTFTGYVTNVPQWLQRASVSVSVSSVEGNPNVMLESIAAGTPVVCSAIPAHRELVDEASAMFVDGTSAESIARGIASVLADPASAAARAARARGALTDRSADAIAAQYESLYRSLAEGRR
jgi:glycosyltransferase involved in cell wall biosynthesis